MSSSRQFSRRTLLRGMGAAMALPLLDAMAPATARAATMKAKAPVRMACIYFPNGVSLKDWVPEAGGTDYTLPYSLEPLADFKSAINVFSGLDKAASHQGDGHYAKTANFLTGKPVTKTTGKDISAGGISMDQLAASQLGHLTPLPSLELGIDPVISGIDSNVGYTRLYGSYISWRTPNLPVAKEINPRFVYERLFGEKDAGGKRAQKRKGAEFQSLLDLALDDAKRLRGQLGRDDQVKLDEYLESVHAVEKRIAFSMNKDPRAWKPETAATVPARPEEKVPEDIQEHVKLMLDLMVLAFQTDSTRVLSFMFANDVSGRNFSFLPGVSGGHHDMSHHENKEEKILQYREITKWHTQQLAYFLGQLRAIPEGEGTLLDNSMILFGSSISDGNSHNPANLPIIVAGNAGGALKTGQHIASPAKTPLCNLYSTMLGAMGVEHEAFGDSTGPLKEIVT
ncbi:MAG: DUF1552 domain-containing protein [Candidatus Hydrogenedentes bacterium]|nr:DUF1552 domain-containing protein [Candidatus Hydrogenedentota bacterium]